MSTNSLLLELLLSGFFAIACFKARAGNADEIAMTPRNFLRLTDRLERLRRTRWQWFAMVLVLVFVRLQSGVPLAIELIAALQLVIFLSLPTQKQQSREVAVSKVRHESLSRLASRRVSRGKA
jgi:Mg2+/citrate symporter